VGGSVPHASVDAGRHLFQLVKVRLQAEIEEIRNTIIASVFNMELVSAAS